MFKRTLFVFLLFPILYFSCGAGSRSAGQFTNSVSAQTQENAWPMAGANPQRTSWTPEEVRGQLKPKWFRPIEPYISPKTQIIAANDTIFISTANGLYAFEAGTGVDKWVFPTELPLGNSPTYLVTSLFNTNHPKRLYVGGFDHKLYCLDAQNGQKIWEFEGNFGIQTNPLVIEINNKINIFFGDRGGVEYALIDNGESSSLAWQYQTDGPILFSSAISTDKTTVYFAANDSYGYALDSQKGTLVWKTAKFIGGGFYSFWPVVYRDKVIFVNSGNYYAWQRPFTVSGWKTQAETFPRLDYDIFYDNNTLPTSDVIIGPIGTEPGDWTAGTQTIDASKILEYYEEPNPQESATDPAGLNRSIHKPWRRGYFIINASNGTEYSFDWDNDNQKEYAPISYHGTRIGNRYPPVVGIDNVLYQASPYRFFGNTGGTTIQGWKIGTPFISNPSFNWLFSDEPTAYSGGGRMIYWNHTNDRMLGGVDITSNEPSGLKYWDYAGYGNVGNFYKQLGPDYRMYYSPEYRPEDWPGQYAGKYVAIDGGFNGIYSGINADQNPPVPYKGLIYVHRSNSLIAYTNFTDSVREVAPKTIVPAPKVSMKLPTISELRFKLLQTEVQKMLDAGHLRPGRASSGTLDMYSCHEFYTQYFYNSSSTIYTLSRALPYLPDAMKPLVKQYLLNEFTNYKPYQKYHIGWSGAAREVFDVPPEVKDDIDKNYVPTTGKFWGYSQYSPYDFYPPFVYYALWKYASISDNPSATAAEILDEIKNTRTSWKFFDIIADVPHQYFPESNLTANPFMINAYYAGFYGRKKLFELAGRIVDQYTIDKIAYFKNLYLTSFNKDTPYTYPINSTNGNDIGCRAINLTRNFMYMVPEMANEIKNDPLVYAKVQEALTEYQYVGPFWFVSRTEQSVEENTFALLYDYHDLFQAKALFENANREDLVKYLDVPAFARGDLFYIDNLITAIEAPASNAASPSPSPNLSPSPTPTPTPSCPLGSQGDVNCDGKIDILDLVSILSNFGKVGSGISGDVNGDGKVDILDLVTLLSNFGRSG